MIADPSELEAKQEHLLWKDQTVGHVYNRLVDFFFEETVNATIREAYVKGFGTARLGVLSVVVVSGLTSIGSMAITNFVMGFDFKWLLFTFTLPGPPRCCSLYREHGEKPHEDQCHCSASHGRWNRASHNAS